MNDSLAPFRIFQSADPDRFELMLCDGDMELVEDVFHGLNEEANGHGWQLLAKSVIAEQLPRLATLIAFDSEGGMFVALSPDASALRELASELRSAFHDHSYLERLISQMQHSRRTR